MIAIRRDPIPPIAWEVLQVCVSASCAALLLGSPIGLLGGACFGLIRYVTYIPIRALMRSIPRLSPEHPFVRQIRKICSFAVPFFGGLASTQWILALAGSALPFLHILGLGIWTNVFFFGLNFCKGKEQICFSK